MRLAAAHREVVGKRLVTGGSQGVGLTGKHRLGDPQQFRVAVVGELDVMSDA